MRLLRIALIAAIVSLFAAPAMAQTVGVTDKEVQAIADPIIDNILAGMKESNYAKFCKDFGGLMMQDLNPSKFDSRRQEIRRQIGDYKSRHYMGFLNQRGMTVALWRARYSGIDDDVLIKLHLSKDGGKIQVKGLFFHDYF